MAVPGTTLPETVLRRLRPSDAPAVHAAFASADDMARQGEPPRRSWNVHSSVTGF